MKFDLNYNGQLVNWPPYGKYKATSGMKGFQTPQEACTPDAGPVPEGFYTIFTADHGTAKNDGKDKCNLSPSWGVQSIPRGEDAAGCDSYWANWGYNRVRMEPADRLTKLRCDPINRSGFYLHDSTKGYSHGCIEIETSFVSDIREYRIKHGKNLIIQIKYIGTSTNGGTKI